MDVLPTNGTVRPVTRWGADVMHAPCRPVETFDDALGQLVADMAATMYAADGVGLAANQVGVDLQVFVFDCPHEDGAVRGVVCNPRLSVPEGPDRHLVEADEGCLSLPGAYVPLARPDFAVVDGVDHTGRPVRYEGKDFVARCLQHETDHLHGTVFGDRLSTRLRKRLYKEAARLAENYPPDWPVEGLEDSASA